MLRRLADARAHGDEGAVAVLTAIVVVFLLIPLSAVAIGSYTRSGVGAEVHRGGDSGALAGASNLGLTNLGQLGSVLPLPTLAVNSNNLLGLPPLESTLRGACTNALKAYGLTAPASPGTSTPTSWTSSAVNDPKNPNKVNINSPLGRAFGEITRCKASYTPPPSLASCLDAAQGVADPLLGPVNQVLGSTVLNLQNVLNAVPSLRLGLVANVNLLGIDLNAVVNSTANALLSTLVTQLQSAISQLTQLNRILTSLLPALLRNGVVVDLDYEVQGPLDKLLTNGPTTATTRSAARRVFQPLLPSALALPAGVTIGTNVGGSTTVAIGGLALNTGLNLSGASALSINAIEVVIATLRQVVNGVGPIGTDLAATLTGRDGLLNAIYAPVTGTLNGLRNLPIVGGLLAPLLAPLSVLPPRAPLDLTSVLPACLPAIDDLLDDLTDALTVNRDPDNQDLLSCLTQQVLGVSGLPTGLGNTLDLPGLNPSLTPLVTTSDCVNRIFRAQIGPNPTYAQVAR